MKWHGATLNGKAVYKRSNQARDTYTNMISKELVDKVKLTDGQGPL